MKLYLLMCTLTVLVHVKSHYRDTHGHDHIILDTCTGVWVGPNKILTAGHCLAESDYPVQWIRTEKNESFEVNVVDVDYPEDMALLAPVNKQNHLYARLGNPAEITDPVYTANWGGETRYTYNEGKVIARDALEYSEHLFLLSNMLIEGGASGGGVFNSKGELVGMIVRHTGQHSTSIDIPLIKTFLKKNGIE